MVQLITADKTPFSFATKLICTGIRVYFGLFCVCFEWDSLLQFVGINDSCEECELDCIKHLDEVSQNGIE